MANKEEILKSTFVGCFYCKRIYSPAEIEEWIPDKAGETAMCPHCAIDSVIGDASGIELTSKFLEEMHERWFLRTISLGELERLKGVTADLREQKDPLFIGIGSELTKKGFDLGRLVVADMFTEDSSQYYVVVVTDEKGVFEFYYDFLHKDPAAGSIIEWHDFTQTPDKAYCSKSVKSALEFFHRI